MSKTQTPAALAAAELAYRSLAKSERGARPSTIPAEIWKLGGADLRALAGDLAQGITTHVEAKAQARAEAKAAAPAKPSPAAQKAQTARKQTANVRVALADQRSDDRAAAQRMVALGRANGQRIPRWVSAVAAGRMCPSAK